MCPQKITTFVEILMVNLAEFGAIQLIPRLDGNTVTYSSVMV